MPFLNLYLYGNRPAPFQSPLRLFRVTACPECAAAWLQPSYDYIRRRPATETGCQICGYLERLEAGVSVAPGPVGEVRQLELFEVA